MDRSDCDYLTQSVFFLAGKSCEIIDENAKAPHDNSD